MVCAKCQKLVKQTTLATPSVKKKNESYLGSMTKSTGGGQVSASTTLSNSGVSKSKLLSKGAKNPYAAYSSSCDTCKTKVEQGRKYCQRCAYGKNACPMCGKSMGAGAMGTAGNSKAPLVTGQKFSAK